MGLFYFVWQVPHFWLLVMLHYGDYDNGGYPTAMRLFGKNTLQKLTFVWLVMTIQTGYFMVSIFEPVSMLINILLFVTGLLAFASSLQLLYKKFELKHARKVFVQINFAFLATVILIAIDKYIQVSPIF